MDSAGEGKELIVGTMCNLCITITNTCNATQHTASDLPQKPFQHYLLYEVEVESNFWMISGRNKGVISIPGVAMAKCSVTLAVMPLTGGYLPFPDVRLCKYDSGDEIDRKTVEEDSESKESGKGTEPSAELSEQKSAKPHSSRSHPVVTPFLRGQVYNCSKAAQVKVLPSNSPT